MPSALSGIYAFLVLLAAGVYLALPAERPVAVARRFRIAGMLVGGAGLIGLAVHLVRWIGSGFEGQIFFVLFALIAVLAALQVVTHRRPVYSAVYFVMVMLAVTGLCVLAAAEFLAASLVIVYGGAILVTYVFVIMLAQQAGEADYDARAREPFAAVAMGFALLAAVTQAMVSTDAIASHAAQSRHTAVQAAHVQRPTQDAVSPESKLDPAAANGTVGNVRQLGRLLVGDYMIAVQVAGVLMLVAMGGAIAIARKRIDPSSHTAYEESQVVHPTSPRGRNVEPFAKVDNIGNR